MADMDGRPLSRSLSSNMKEQIRLQSGNHVREATANDKCTLILTLYSGVARPGDTIAGSIDLQVRTKFSLRAVCIVWYGYEEVDFNLAKKSCEHLAKLHKAGADTDFDLNLIKLKPSKKKVHSVLLDSTMTLWGKKGKLISDEIEPGEYTFPFTFKLPEDVTSYSYFDRFATVTYQATAFLDMPLLKRNIRVSVPFAVATHGVDPEVYRHTHEVPEQYEAQKVIKVVCLPRGRVVLQAILPQHALLSEDMFTVMMNIINETKVDVKGIFVDLLIHLTYRNKKGAKWLRMIQRKRVVVPDSQVPAGATQDKMVHISFPVLGSRVPLLPTYQSDLVGRSYTMEVRLLAKDSTRTSPDDLVLTAPLELHPYKGLPRVPHDDERKADEEQNEDVRDIQVYVPAPLDTFDIKDHRSVYPELPPRYEAVPQPLPQIDVNLGSFHKKVERGPSPELVEAPPQAQVDAPPAYVPVHEAQKPLFGEQVAVVDVADERVVERAQENIHDHVEGEGYIPAVDFADKPLPEVPQYEPAEAEQEQERGAVIAMS